VGLGTFVFIAASVWAKDSSDLAKSRRDNIEKLSFYCAIGRTPILNSAEALTVQPSSQCKFSGPLDTKLDSLSLQPPILNPLLSVSELKMFLQANGVSADGNDPVQFSISGTSFTAATTAYKNLRDPLFHLKAYPPEWGETFVTISTSRQGDLNLFTNFARAHSERNLFWKNPHFLEEQNVLSRRQHPLPYLPIEMASKCDLPKATPHPSLLLVGDLHDPPQSQYFLSLLQTYDYAWVGLEIDHAQEPIYQHFVNSQNPQDEEKDLNFFVRQFPRNIQDNFKNILRLLKTKKATVVFVNSADSYFNFPFTNVSFHGLIVAARNRIWVNNLPDSWTGQAVLFGGLDHFTNFPGSDFQNFAIEKYPGLQMSLVSPFDTCAP